MSDAQQPLPDDTRPDSDSTSTSDILPPGHRKHPRWLILFRPKVGIPLAILIVLLSIPLAIRSWRISSLPPIDEPFDVEAFCSVTIPDEENAFVEYREAFDLFVENTATQNDWNSLHNMKDDDWDTAPIAFKKWIPANAQSLEIWIEGTKKPKACWTLRKDTSYDGVEYIGTARSMARLVVMKVRQELHQNNPQRAWPLLYSAFRFSRHIGQDGILMERIVGASILPLVTSGLLSWAHHSQTTADDLEHAISILSKDYETMTSPHSIALKHEYIASKKLMTEITYGAEIFDDNLVLDSALLFVLGEPEFSNGALAHVYKNHLEGVDQDLALRPPYVRGLVDLFDIPESANHPVSGKELSKLLELPTAIGKFAMYPFLEQMLEGRELERTFQTTMLAILAIERFVRLHGRFPRTLGEELDSDSLQLFLDPQAKVPQQLIYKSDEKYAVVYSVGPDGIDDGHGVAPAHGKQQTSWSQLRNKDRRWFEGYRIPLLKPVATNDEADEDATVAPDNVQD